MDLGSQTFRIAGAEVTHSEAKVLFSLRENVRMGASLMQTGKFSEEAMRRGISALKYFMTVVAEYEIGSFMAIGTAAFRKASNATTFLAMAKDIGIPIEIISSEQEASLAVKGAYLTLEHDISPWIMVDCGGGSTEIELCFRNKIQAGISLDLGAVSLTDACLRSGRDLRLAASKKIQQGISDLKETLSVAKAIVATGGTATTIASVALGLSQYDPSKVRGFEISFDELETLYEKISALDIKSRKKLKGLEAERADIFPAGIAILLELIRYLGLSKLIISDGGILLGLLTAFMEKECNFYVESSSARGLYL